MLWVGGSLPWYARASIRSFLFHGNRVRLHAYEDLDVPPGCDLSDANAVLHRENIFRYKHGEMAGHLSGFADWFRYELLRQQGGWWVDTDVIAIKQITTDEDYVFASGWEPDIYDCINNNVIYAKDADSDIMRAAAAECSRLRDEVQHAETGPVLLQKLVREFDLGRFTAAPGRYNPVHYGDIHRLSRPETYVSALTVYRKLRGRRPILLSEHSECVHLYAAMLEAHLKIRDTSELNRSSFLYRLLARNGALD